MNHKFISVKRNKDLIQAIDKTMANEFLPTLAFVYASVSCNIPSLFKKLGDYTFTILGASTVGEIYADKRDGVQTLNESIICMLVDLNPLSFSLKVKEVKNDDYYALGRKMGTWVASKFKNRACLTITAGLNFDNESYVEGLQTEVTHLFGGVAGDDRVFKETYVFSHKKITTSGSLVLALNQDMVDIVNTCGFGWSGIGTQRVVTKSIKNVVYTIDDKPAINFYKDYLNITVNDMPDMGLDYPLEVLLSDGQIVYRAAIYINEEEGSLMFAGHVKQGSKVRISAPIGEKVIDDVKMSIEEALAFRSDFEADLTLIFPCAAHKALLGSSGIKEIETVYNVTNNRPLIGFYVYGEISSSIKSTAFHNETFVTVQLKEK